MHPVQDAVDRLASQVGQPVLVEDARHQPLWWSAQGTPDGVRARTILQRSVDPAAAAFVKRLGLANAHGAVRTPALPAADMKERWCVPLRHGRTLLGYLWVVDAEGCITDAELPEVLRCAQQATQWLATAVDGEHHHELRRDELVRRLARRRDEAAAAELAELERLAPDATVAVDATGGQGGWELPDGLVAVANPAAEHLTSGAPLPLADLSTAVQRARTVQRVLRAGAVLTTPTWTGLGAWHLIAAAPEHLTPAQVHPGADVLLALPRPDLAATARAVLDAGSDMTAAAARLHIHRTTLYYRLDRIRALTGVDLKTGPGREDLHAALWLAALRAAGD